MRVQIGFGLPGFGAVTRTRTFGNLSCVASIAFHRGGVDPVNHELDRDVITIGRAPSNDIVIDDPTVSACHASLTKLATGCRLSDLSTTNGTQINGVPITEAELKDGNEIWPQLS